MSTTYYWKKRTNMGDCRYPFYDICYDDDGCGECVMATAYNSTMAVLICNALYALEENDE